MTLLHWFFFCCSPSLRHDSRVDPCVSYVDVGTSTTELPSGRGSFSRGYARQLRFTGEILLLNHTQWHLPRRQSQSTTGIKASSAHWHFQEVLIVTGKLGSFSHASFPDEVACGWIYTIRPFPVSRSPNWEFHCSSGSVTEIIGVPSLGAT